MSFMNRLRGFVGLPAGTGRPAPRSEYMRGGRGITMSGWRPTLRTSNEDVVRAWNDAAARATDLIQNSGWVSGMIDQCVANVVGTGLTLRCMPENDLIGMTEDEAQAWRKKVEALWELYARNPYECDLEGRRTVAEMQDAQFRTWLATGETFSESVVRERDGGKYLNKIRVMFPTEIDTASDEFNRIVCGVRLDADNMPIGYVKRVKDPILGQTTVGVRARDQFGRLKIVHQFVGMPGTVRGITPLVPALKVGRQFDQLADATLTSQLMQAVFAATLTAEAPTEEMMTGLLSAEEQAKAHVDGESPFAIWNDAAAGWYDNKTIDVGISGRVAHLFPGQELKFLTPAHPASAYKEFAFHLLAELARCLGLTTAAGTGNYDGVTYTGARMSVHEVHPISVARRKNIVGPSMQPHYEAWLDECIFTGRIEFPGGYDGFMAHHDAACRSNWRGAPKPTADDLKTAKALQIYQNMGVITDEAIADSLDMDIEDVYAQRAREKAWRETYGLPEPSMTGQQAPADDAASEDNNNA